MSTFLAAIGGIVALLVVFVLLAGAICVAGGVISCRSRVLRVGSGLLVAVVLVGGLVAALHTKAPAAVPDQHQQQMSDLQRYRDEIQRQMQEQQPSPAPSTTTTTPTTTPDPAREA